jgi:hypothetical protein
VGAAGDELAGGGVAEGGEKGGDGGGVVAAGSRQRDGGGFGRRRVGNGRRCRGGWGIMGI